MGKLFYGSSEEPIQVDDRALAHLKMVIIQKLRRNESFTVSWQHDDGTDGRSTLWLHPSIPLRFEFDERDAPEIDRGLLEEMAERASESAGIRLTTESIPIGSLRGRKP